MHYIIFHFKIVHFWKQSEAIPLVNFGKLAVGSD